MTKSTTIEVNVQWKNEDIVIIRMIGEAGLQNADHVERQFLPVVASKPRLVIVDLEALDFIGSLGLGMLVELQRSLARSGGIMRLIHPQPDIMDVIRKCRLETVFKFCDTFDEALATETADPAK